MAELDSDLFAAIKNEDGDFIGITEEGDAPGDITILVIRTDENDDLRLWKMKLPQDPEPGDEPRFALYNDMVFESVEAAGQWVKDELKRRTLT